MNKVNITQEAEAVLKTVILLGQPYGLNYLVRILQGNLDYGVKDLSHKNFETFGALKELRLGKIQDTVKFLIRKEFLKVVNKRYGLVSITEKGESFLENPETLEVHPSSLYTSKLDRKLIRSLRELRKELGEKEQKPAFHIFTDYAIQCIVEAKPANNEELKELPGFGEFKIEAYGQQILAIIEEAEATRIEKGKERLNFLVNTPSHQQVKALFEAGESIEDIADKRQVQPTTVKTCLYRLHAAGQIDLNPWIEQQIEDSDLKKGSEYFHNAPNSKLKEAHEKLGMDYETLRLCRMYVNKIQSV